MTRGVPMRRVFAALAAGLPLPMTAQAGDGKTADFIVGTYVMEGRCDKLAALEAGGSRNVETVPETLTAKGFESWEGGCTFASLKETDKGRVYEATMHCSDAAEEWTETDTFSVGTDQSITVTVDGTSTRFVTCGPDKGN